MSGTISNQKAGRNVELRVSNTGMGVVLDVLLLAASDLAKDPWEVGFACFLAEKDQSISGWGGVDFDIDNIAWQPEHFSRQKAFVLQVIAKAREKHRWDCLPYDPPYVLDYLATLHHVVDRYVEGYVTDGRVWTAEPIAGKCPIHNVYMHEHGCQICNEHPQ